MVRVRVRFRVRVRVGIRIRVGIGVGARARVRFVFVFRFGLLPVTHTLDLMATRVDANAVVVLVVEVVLVGKFAVLDLLVQVDARVDTHGGVLPQRSQVHGRARRACWQCDCLWHK